MDDLNRDPDQFTRNSFTLRGMTRWQAWAITICAVVILAALLMYAL